MSRRFLQRPHGPSKRVSAPDCEKRHSRRAVFVVRDGGVARLTKISNCMHGGCLLRCANTLCLLLGVACCAPQRLRQAGFTRARKRRASDPISAQWSSSAK
jgi:hypothetical protein